MPQTGAYVIGSPLPAEERLRAYKDAGFDFVCCGIERIAEGITPELCDRIGLGFENVHLSGAKTNFIWSEGEIGDAVCRRYCREIEAMSDLGIHTGIIHVTWGKSVMPEPPGETGFARYEAIRETAARRGFTVCVENSIFPGHFYSVLDRFDVPEFAHCFDCGHWNAFAKEHDFFGKYGHRVAATHIHDNDGAHDLHILPFDGTIDWEALAARFAANPFTREKICSESGGPKTLNFAGKTAEEIASMLSCMRVAADPEMMKVSDGAVTFYGGIGYAEFVSILHGRMKKLADMIDEAAKKTKRGIWK